MKKLWILGASLVFASSATSVQAAGPIDGEIGAIYWNSEFDSSGVAALASDSGSPGFRAQLWLFNKYGVKAGMYRTDLDDFGSIETSNYTSVDVMWRPLSPTQNNYLAVGLGWQEMDLHTIGLQGDTSGVRLNVDGRVGLGKIIFAYGEASYLPKLSDAAASTPGFGQFESMSGYEYELGVSVKPFPFIQVRAGYRMHSVDFDQIGLDPLLGFGAQMKGTAESSGILAGLTFNF
jgi:opacity protein-like surface antigen